ncbi:hypothetical protein PROFUN_01142 [Planoprotostelium fungivorum]|uniref:Autophagy-related protein 27 n=1 Tax=Planoprotostelium fungivorum TaxID=1890364 RepID=A0A2P6NCG9_9EUKA|nr:hypothetical protein PROFUN_01142 [Planoprotostelium fungivorum]
MRTTRIIWLSLFCILTEGLRVFKDVNPQPRSYVGYRTHKGSIILDGKLDEPAWQEVPWTEDFLDIQGTSQPTPRYKTHAKMRFDDDFLYIGAWLEEPQLSATINTTNAVIFNDNDFEIFINPSGNLHLYNEYEMNALNTTWTLVEINPYRDGYNIIDPYPMIGMKTAVYLNGTLNDPSDVDCCWSAEIALPLGALKQFAEKPVPRDKDQWRINFSRVEWKYKVVDGKYVKVPNVAEDNWVWSPQQVIDMHQPERWGFLQFSDAKPGEDSFQFDRLSYDTQQVLSWLYFAQREYFTQTNGTYATSFSQLGVSEKSFDASLGATPIDPSIRLHKIERDDFHGFDVSLLHLNSGGTKKGSSGKLTRLFQVERMTKPGVTLTNTFFSCVFALSIVILSVQADWTTCTYSSNGKEIDLSAFKAVGDKSVTFSGLESPTAPAETWYFSLCQGLKNSALAPDGGCNGQNIAAGPVSVCQTYSEGQYSSYVMGSVPSGGLGPNFIASTIPGVVLDVQGLQGPTNGQANGDKSAQAIIIHLKCGVKNDIVNATGNNNNAPWTFTWTDPSLCSVEENSPSEEYGKTGWILVGVFLGILFAYFLVGLLVNKFYLKKEGSEVVPNIGFWAGLGALIKDGVMFVVNKARGKQTSYATV